MITIDPSDAVPIWKQIEDEMRRVIAIGAYPPGTAVPSVRELALDLRINPATASKAYQRLSEAGVLVVRRGEGTFVSETMAEPSKRAKRQTLGAAARRYASVAATVGAAEEEALDVVRQALDATGVSLRSRR